MQRRSIVNSGTRFIVACHFHLVAIFDIFHEFSTTFKITMPVLHEDASIQCNQINDAKLFDKTKCTEHGEDTEISSDDDGRKEGNKRTQTLRRARELFERRSTSLYEQMKFAYDCKVLVLAKTESGVCMCVLYLQ